MFSSFGLFAYCCTRLFSLSLCSTLLCSATLARLCSSLVPQLQPHHVQPHTSSHTPFMNMTDRAIVFIHNIICVRETSLANSYNMSDIDRCASMQSAVLLVWGSYRSSPARATWRAYRKEARKSATKPKRSRTLTLQLMCPST